MTVRPLWQIAVLIFLMPLYWAADGYRRWFERTF